MCKNWRFKVTGNEKFELEFMTTEELCLVAKNHKAEIEKLKRDMKLFGKEDESYTQWKNELWTKQRRYRYIIKRIESRQLTLF